MFVALFFLMCGLIALAGVLMLILTAWHHWEKFVHHDADPSASDRPASRSAE